MVDRLNNGSITAVISAQCFEPRRQASKLRGLRASDEDSTTSQTEPTQKALRESERRYRDFFDNATDAIYVHDLNGRYTLINNAGIKLIGYSRAEILEMNIGDVVSQQSLEQIKHNFDQKLRNHEPTIYEVDVITRDGKKIPIEVNSRLIYERGVPVGVQGTARDITERKRAEKALRESEEQFRALFENAKDVLFTCDLSGNFTSLNRAGEIVTEYSREEAVGMNFAQVVAPEHLHIAKEMLSRKAQADVATTYELEIVTKSRRRVLFEISSRSRYREGKVIGVQGSARDITERKSAEEALRRSEEQYRILFESNPLPMWVFDLETLSLLALNEAAVRHYGYTREAFLSLKLQDLHPSLEEAEAMASRLNRIESLSDLGEWRHRTAIGSIINVVITANITQFSQRQAGLMLAHDITERKRAEEALHSSQLQLQQSQKLEAIGQLAGGVAHDFNNLLTAISGYTDLSLRRLSEDDPVRRNLLETKKASERAASLTRQLLAFSRKQILEPKVLDLNLVVHDMHKMLQRLIGEDIVLSAKLAINIGKVKADPGQVQQIIMNLIVNARDAMPRGGMATIETGNVRLDEAYMLGKAAVQPGDYVMLAMSDTGCGMDEKTLARIFEPFFTTKEAGKGTGLGLSTVYGIVKQSGGYISAYSEVGAGTVFKVYLPRIAGDREPVKLKTVARSEARGTETILLVEDETVVRRMSSMILESNGYRVLQAADATEALAIFDQHRDEIELLLTDVIMPGMSGRVLAEKIGLIRAELPVLYMSGYTDDAIVRHGLLCDGLEFLQKPFTSEVLTNKVRDVLDARKSSGDLL
ncbi:MAG TPA: PAS domain S-box protein [Pyrinomonadaceae bacterium]|nr:PAS domain S-box protein [Pyrinomonadaceae bacterium]